MPTVMAFLNVKCFNLLNFYYLSLITSLEAWTISLYVRP